MKYCLFSSVSDIINLEDLQTHATRINSLRINYIQPSSFYLAESKFHLHYKDQSVNVTCMRK
jgi:hypothetical protein